MRYQTTLSPIDIRNFIDTKQLEDESYKISFPTHKLHNIYQFLKDIGFSYVRVNRNSFFILQEAECISKVSFEDLRDSFISYLKKANYSVLSQEISWRAVVNCYYRNPALIANNSIKRFLKKELSDNETHKLLLEIDYDYLKEQQIKTMFEKFDEAGFIQTDDLISTYHTNDKNLFYKKIDSDKYLVINELNIPKGRHRTFDCWLSSFRRQELIGKIRPYATVPIITDFRWERDFDLIQDYLN